MIQEIRLLRRLLVVLLILIGVYVGLKIYSNPEGEKVAREQVEQITAVHVADIKAVALKNESGAFGLIVEPGGRISLVPPDITAREYSLGEMQGFIYLVSKMSSIRVIAKVDSLEDFGLESPLSVLTIIKADGSKERILLGRESDRRGNHYLMVEGSDKIYVVSSGTAKLLLRSRVDFVERELIPNFRADEIDRLSSIEVTAASRPDRAYRIENKGGYRFELSSPIRNTLRTEKFFAEIVLPVSTLYPDKLVEGAINLDPDASDYVLELDLDGKKYTVLLWKKNSETFYVKELNSRDIFEVPVERISFLDKDYIELVSGAIYSTNASGVDSIIFDDIAAGTGETLYISGEGEEIQGELDGRIIPFKELMTFVNMLNSISMVEEFKGERVIDAEPNYSITVNKRDGSRDYIEFVSAGGGKSFFRVNGEVNFIIFDDTLSKIAEALNGLSAEKK